ncbi:Uncharacterised protein [Vibrio cholerae]|nr:Uncharacterised protein [Vibrio cholerae]
MLAVACAISPALRQGQIMVGQKTLIQMMNYFGTCHSRHHFLQRKISHQTSRG